MCLTRTGILEQVDHLLGRGAVIVRRCRVHTHVAQTDRLHTNGARHGIESHGALAETEQLPHRGHRTTIGIDVGLGSLINCIVVCNKFLIQVSA